MGTVHGGWFATLLDSALGCAVHTRMEPGRGYTTRPSWASIWSRPSRPKVQARAAEGRMIHSGRQLATAEARLRGAGWHAVRARHHHLLGFDLPTQSKA